MHKHLGSIEIAFFVFLIATLISKTTSPERVGLLGNWIAVLGDTLQAISETDLYIKDVKEEKIKEINEINNQIKDLQKRLEELKCH